MNKWKKELKNSSNIVYFSYETSQHLNRCVSKNWGPTIEVLENVKHLTFSVWTVQGYFKIYVNVFIQVIRHLGKYAWHTLNVYQSIQFNSKTNKQYLFIYYLYDVVMTYKLLCHVPVFCPPFFPLCFCNMKSIFCRRQSFDG